MTKFFHFCILLALSLTVSGCATLGYYAQAVKGQMEILVKSRPVEDILEDPTTAPQTRQQLALSLPLRKFASRELGLPDNHSYRRYADLGRPFVLWNVFATPELSLEPQKWCFLVAGCVAYRGYFVRERAEKFAAELKPQGYDVYVGGVAAYSTLGWFDDPLLNTFIHRSEAELAGLLFHELAHQVLYLPDDSTFNESFATAVELEGVKRWFRQNGKSKEAEAYLQKMQRREEFVALVLKHRARLANLYASQLNDAEKRATKTRVFDELRADYGTLKATWSGNRDYDAWFAPELNNAKLVAVGLYHQYVPAFQTLLAQSRGDLAVFYRAAQELARQPPAERTATLMSLSPES